MLIPQFNATLHYIMSYQYCNAAIEKGGVLFVYTMLPSLT